MSDDALLASVMRKLAATSGVWFGAHEDKNGEPWVTIDGSAKVTPEEDAAIERMWEELHP